MFRSAKIKLTLWYLSIIMLVTLAFSYVIYKSISEVSLRILVNQQNRIERHYSSQRLGRMPVPPLFNEESAVEFREQILNLLIRINLGVFIFSGGLGYILAGRTLKPIEKMVGEQRRFISDAAHELKTPLTSLKTEIEVSLRSKDLKLEETKETLTSNLEEVNKIIKLTNSLLAESRYDKDTDKPELKETNLSEVALEAINRHTKSAQHKKINLQKELIPQIVMADRDSITELASTLIDNAIKYSNEKGEVRIKVYNLKNHPILEVTDKGIGIKREDLPYIFNRFYRADASRSKQNENGFGLGLAIAKNIAKQHNVKIEVKSEINKGSTFTLLFPIIKPS